jgi:hypothetical protein
MKLFLRRLSRFFLYIVLIVLIFGVVTTIFSFAIYTYEEKIFIQDCIKDGTTQEKCQIIWEEVSELD